MKNALILGVTGQDGSYLADFLLKKDYHVFGSYRRTSHRQLERLEAMNTFGKVELIYADLIDQSSLNRIIKITQPDEIYNLAAQSFVGVSFVEPFLTTEITGIGALRVFEAVREFSPHSKVYQRHQVKCLEILMKLKQKIPDYNQLAHMELLKCLHIKPHKCIENLMTCSLAVEFYLIMNLLSED